MQALKEGNLTFPWRSSSPGHQPLRVSQPDVMGDHLPRAGSQGWGTGSRTRTSLILREDLLHLRQPLLLECLCARSMGLEETVSAPPTYFGVVFIYL